MKITKNQALIIFNAIFWTVLSLAIALTSLTFSKVPIGYYGLRASAFTANVETEYYIPGLYNSGTYHVTRGIAYYFILFPSSLQYISDIKITTSNRNQQPITLNYSLSYCLNPNQLHYLYTTYQQTYEDRLTSILNVITPLFRLSFLIFFSRYLNLKMG